MIERKKNDPIYAEIVTQFPYSIAISDVGRRSVVISPGGMNGPEGVVVVDDDDDRQNTIFSLMSTALPTTGDRWKKKTRSCSAIVRDASPD